MPTLTTIFDLPWTHEHIRAFRGAVSEAADPGRQIPLWHNHEGQSLRYSYPLIQYRVIGGKAAIVAFNEAMPLLRRFVLDAPEHISIMGQSYPFKLIKLEETETHFGLSQHIDQAYYMPAWMGLNQDNYELWQQAPDLQARTQLLERILSSQLVNLCKQFGFRPEQRIELRIDRVERASQDAFRKAELMAFRVWFSCNVQLPRQLSMGKGSSVGFGLIQRAKNNGGWLAPQVAE